MDRQTFVALLQNEQAHPIALMRGLIRHYGVDWMGWFPTVLRRTLEKDFGQVVPIGLPKMLGTAAVARHPSFWEHWEYFHFLVPALNNVVPDMQTHKSLTVGQMMVAVDIANTIRGELGDLSYVPQFSEEVSRYVAAQAAEAGIWHLPAPLEFAARYAEGRRYRCHDCGNDAEIIFSDGLCDSCVDRFNTTRLGGWDADPELVAAGRGRNVTLYARNPVGQVQARLAAITTGRQITLQQSQTDVCVAKLVVALQYVEFRRKQLREQAA